MTQQEVWDLVAQNERLLRRESRRYLPASRYGELDELYSDVVIMRAHSIMATYRPEFGVLPITHLCANVRWYAYKWVHRRCYKYVPPPVDTSRGKHDEGYDSDHEIKARVSLILDSLPEDAANILKWHIIQECTFGEIAAHFDPPITRAQVKSMYRDALELARQLNMFSTITGWLEGVRKEA